MAVTLATRDAVKDFLKSNLKIYVCGDSKKRPPELVKQSSIKLLSASSENRTIFAEPAKNSSGVIDVSFDKPIEGGKLAESITKSSRDFTELSNTLRELGNITWVMDKDAILKTFALDTDPNKTKRKAFEKHFEEFSKAENYQLTNQLGPRDKQMLYDEVMSDKNNPFSLAIPSTTVEGNVGFINPADPDMPIHDMFFPYMKEKGIKLEEYNQFINLHEAGHANDRRNHRDMFSDKNDTNWKRHRTESVADTFATLMMAKKTGNLEIGKLAAEVRMEYTVKGLAYIQNYVEEQKRKEEELKRQQEERRRQEEQKKSEEKTTPPSETGRINPSSLSARLGKYADKNFGKKGGYVGNPDLKIFIEEQKRGKVAGRHKEPSFVDTIINRFDGAKSGFFRTPEDVLGSVFAYTTTPTVDATLKVAEEKLKDGSLQKMSTKELYSLAEKMVDENTYGKEQIATMISSFMKGVATPEVDGILKRKEASDLETTGNKVKSTRMSAKETEAYDTNFKATIKSDAKADVIDAVEKEKDSLRDITPFEKEYKHAHAKINHLNKEYIDKKDEIKAKILANKKNHAKKTPIKKLIDKGNYR